MNNPRAAYGRIGVLYGGISAEREISLQSGQAVIESLQHQGADCVAIDLDGSPVIELIQKANINTAFIALHGGIGEDGRLQSLLNLMGIAYTGSGVQASVVAMNKLIAKQIWAGIGLPTPRFSLLEANRRLNECLAALGGQVMVKPAHEGSSIGMAIAQTATELEDAYVAAQAYDSCVFAEELLEGEEYTVSVVNGHVLPAIKLETDHRFYDYHAKYLANDTRYLCPCGLSDEKEEALKALALWAFNSLGCRGWGRVDVMVDKAGCFSVLEVNTVPGLTTHSLVPMAAKAAGLSFDELVVAILVATNGSRVETK